MVVTCYDHLFTYSYKSCFTYINSFPHAWWEGGDYIKIYVYLFHAMLLFNITRLLASALWQKLWLQLDSSIICVCFFLTERLLLQKLLLASSINKVDHSLVKIKPYNFSLNLNRQGTMQTSLTRRPLTIQATYRYSLCFSGFVMTTLSLREYSK